MGICNSTNDQKTPKNKDKANAAGQPLTNAKGNKKTQNGNNNGIIDMDDINVGFVEDMRSPPKLTNPPSSKNGSIAKPKENYYVTCPNCSSRIPNIETINYDSTKNAYLIKVQCACMIEMSEYRLSDFKYDRIPATECDSHPGNKLICFCYNCKCDICQKCAETNHCYHQVKSVITQNDINMQELEDAYQKQKDDFARAYREEEMSLNQKCDDIAKLVMEMKENAQKHLREFYNENMMLFGLLKSSYEQYQHFSSVNQTSVAMSNLVSKFNLAQQQSKAELDSNLHKVIETMTSAFEKANQQYSLKYTAQWCKDDSANVIEYKSSDPLKAHTHNVICIEHLSDGRLASGSYDESIRLWDLNNMRCDEVLFETGKVLCLLEFEPKKLLSGTSEQTIQLWDLRTKTKECIFEGHTLWVNCLVKINNELFASGSNDKSIRIWNYTQKQCYKFFKMHTDCILSVCLLTGGNIASGSADTTIRVWNIAKGECVSLLKGHTKWIKCLCQLSNGLLLSGSDDKTLKVWEGKQCITTLIAHEDAIRAVCQINSRQFASASFDKTIKIWSISSLQCMQTLVGHTDLVISLVMLPNDRFASCSNDKTIKIWS